MRSPETYPEERKNGIPGGLLIDFLVCFWWQGVEIMGAMKREFHMPCITSDVYYETVKNVMYSTFTVLFCCTNRHFIRLSIQHSHYCFTQKRFVRQPSTFCPVPKLNVCSYC